ncbi:MAG: hypothetical protein U5K37_11045 [Natrialbaceae archaeon]|nr:hypothetical protein [Natrialbaceae archaeon]
MISLTARISGSAIRPPSAGGSRVARDCLERRTAFDVTDVHLISVLATSAKAALDRRKRQQDLERTREVVDSVGDSVYALDTDGHFVMVNKVLTDKTGYSARNYLAGTSPLS